MDTALILILILRSLLIQVALDFFANSIIVFSTLSLKILVVVGWVHLFFLLHLRLFLRLALK